MDFSKPPHGLVSPVRPAVPVDDTEPGEEMLITQPVIGPAERTRPATPNPMTIEPPGIDTGTSLLAESLNWKVELPRYVRHSEAPDRTRDHC